MSDSLMSRDERAKFLRERRKRMRRAEMFERKRRGEQVFTTAGEAFSQAFASEKFITDEIEWRQRELLNGAREY